MYLDDAYDSIGETPISGSGGIGGGAGGFAFLAGLNTHRRVECNSSGCFDVTTKCGRLGLGLYAGGGAEVSGTIGITNPSEDECPGECTTTWSVGLGADGAFGNIGAGGSLGIGNAGISLGGSYKNPLSLGLGLSAGVEYCETTSCPM